jgi:phosphoglycolate phosphatase
MPPLVVGFDLDMTLIDSRPGIHATFVALSAETGHAIDADLVVNRLGPPLEQEMAHWVPAELVDPLSDRYRALYAEIGIEGGVHPLPGAAAALAAVGASGGRTLVVTAKFGPNARKCLAATGLEVDDVVGSRHGPQKAEALAERGAAIYVGDTPPDISAAHEAGAVAVGVTSGPFDADELRAVGADVVLDSLVDFPAWLASCVAGDPPRPSRRRPS